MDGTIYSGGTLFETTLPFLASLPRMGIGHTFLTNNSSKSTRDYLARLRQLGIPATREQLYTSTQAAIEYLQQQRPELKRLFILGTPSMIEEMAAAGFVSTADSAQDEPDAVLAGFDTTLSYARLCRAQLQPHHLAMVGDRLYTDMAMARRAGAVGVLVLTGETQAHEAAQAVPPPDLVVSGLAELGERLRAARNGHERV